MLVQRTTFGWQFDESSVGLGVVHTGFEYEVVDTDGQVVTTGFLGVEARQHVVDLEGDEAYSFAIRAVASDSSNNGLWVHLDVVVGDLTPALGEVTDLQVLDTKVVELSL